MRRPSDVDVYPEPHRPAPSGFTERKSDPQGWCGSEPRENTEQLWLSPADAWAEKGKALRKLLNRALAANGISHDDLERETGVDARQLGRALTDHGGAHLPLAVWACVLQMDRAGILLPGMAAALGYEVRRKERDLEAENRKLKSALNAAVEALREAAGS